MMLEPARLFGSVLGKRGRVNRPRAAAPARVKRPHLGLERLEDRRLLAQVPLGNLTLSGDFSTSGSGSSTVYSVTGAAVQIGYTPVGSEAYTPLTVWTGDLSFTSGGSSFAFSGAIAGYEQSSAQVAIAQIADTQTFDVADLTGAGVGIGGGGAVGVVGATLTPDSIALVDPTSGDTTDSYVSLQGSLGFSALPGLAVPVSGANQVQISPSSSAPGLTLNSASTITAFSAFGLNLTPGSSSSPVALAVGYSTLSGEFQISGSVSVASATAGDFSATGSLGTADDPGLVIDSGGVVTQLSVTISGSLTVQGLGVTASADDLVLSYINDAGSIYNNEFIIGTGTVTIATSAGDTSFAATFGTGTGASAIPGLVLDNGSLTGFDATVSSTIDAQGLTLSAADVVFKYEGSDFEIAPGGSVSISDGAIEFASAVFGISGSAGLTIDDGVLTGLNITISSSMTVGGMTLALDQVGFSYAAVAGEVDGDFTISPGSTVSLSAGAGSDVLSFTGTLGPTVDGTPLTGLQISGGALLVFNLGVTSDITIGPSGGALTLSTSDLIFSYVGADQTFQIPSGAVGVTDSNGDLSFAGTFGTAATSTAAAVPGLVVTDGDLTGLDITITASLSAGGLGFAVSSLDVDGLVFEYNATDDQYEIATGDVSFSTSEGFSFSASFGLPDASNPSATLPGLVVSGGKLQQVNASLTSSFTVAGLVIDVDDMTMMYSDSNRYSMYGTVTVNTVDVSFTGTIGQPTADPPVAGLVIDDNALESLAITITSSVTFGDLSIQADGLAFDYDSSPESFTLYGSVTTSIAGVTLTGDLGTSAAPGLSIVNGQLDALNLGVTANFTLFDLQCNVQDLTFQYQDEDGNTNYILFGSLSVSVSDGVDVSTMSATMGTSSDPGLIIADGDLTQINMAITGSFEISGFGFQITDAGLVYTSTDDEYLIFGTFTLSDVFSATVQLGTGSSNPGITIVNGVFTLDNFAFSLDNVPIGAFTLNYLTISYASAGDVWSGSASVTFPTGWALAASMTFVDGDLDDISIAYSAGTSPGIAIPDTGIFITGMSASLQNLDQPASIIVSGTIEAVFGDKITIGGTSCSLFAATGSFSADSQQLTIDGDYYQGAYQSGGNWTGILGSGTASVDLDWAAGTYTASVTQSLYDGIFTLSAEMAFDDSGDLGIIATASVNVPNGIPLIGGQHLGSMSFAFLYDFATGSGTVAAWVSVNCYVTTVTAGFEYTFNSSFTDSLSIIGSSQVNSIENSFNSITSTNASTPTIYNYLYTVTVPEGSGAYGFSVQAAWPANLGTQTLYAAATGSTTPTYTATSTDLPSNYQFLTAYANETTQSIMLTGSPTDTSVPLAAGTYTFQISSTYQFASTSDVAFTNQMYYEPPSVAITGVPSTALAFTPAMSGFAAGALAANTTITLYADTNSSGYQGKEVGSFAYDAVNGVLQNVATVSLASYAPGVPVYIYAIINDGTNPTVNSAYSAAIIPVPDLVGTVVDQFSNPIAGIRVFLDLNDNQTYDAPAYSGGTLVSAGDPSAITNSGGGYYFNNLAGYSGTDIGYPVFRVMAVMPTPSYTPITPSDDVNTFTFSADAGASFTADFIVNRLASISGSLYSDLDRDGVEDASDPPLGGVTVFLDTDGSGGYDPGDLTCVTGPSGSYGFYDLTPGGYAIGIITTTAAGSSTIASYVVTQPSPATYSVTVTSDSQQLAGYAFGVISLATVSGTVTSQGSGDASSSPSPGVTVTLSTPDVSATVPDYENFTSTAGLNLVGSSATASASGGLSLLATGQSSAASAAWFTTPVPVAGGFQTSYQWSMTAADATSGGLAFVLQNVGTSAVGSTSYGYGGLGTSIAVIFDAVANEVLIESGGDTSAAAAIAVLTGEQLGFTLASGTVYTARITFAPTGSGGVGTLSVYLSGDSSGGSTPVLTASVDLGSILDLGGAGTAVAGFTAGTAGTGLAASISGWSLTAFNTQSTTTDSLGNYAFTGLMPGTTYTISQAVPSGSIQSSPYTPLGAYSASTLAPLGAIASGVASGDFNGDGIPDVAYAVSMTSGAAYQIIYAYGNGDGGFAAPVLVTLPVPPGAPALATPADGASAFDASIVAGNFDIQSHDQIAYVATMASGGTAIVVYDIASGTILNLLEIVSSTVAPAAGGGVAAGYLGTINNVAAGDLNNDGYDDLAISTYGGVAMLVTLQNDQSAASWTLNPATLTIPLGIPSAIDSSEADDTVAYDAGVVLADFNQDGNLDLATIGVQYIPGLSQGRDGPTPTWTNLTVGTTIQLAYGLGNGVSFSAQNQLTFQLYDSSGQYFSAGGDTSPAFPLPFGMGAPDIDDDGVPDLVLNGYTDTLQPAVTLLIQANGNFANFGVFALPNGQSFNVNATFGTSAILPGSSLAAARVVGIDLNGDGFDDIAAIDPNVGQVLLLTSNAAPLTSGQSSTDIVFSTGALPQFAAADFGMNGYPDLIVPGEIASATQGGPTLVLNGTLNTGEILYTPTNGQALTGQGLANFSVAGSPAGAAALSGADAVAASPSPGRPADTVAITGQVFIDRNMNSRFNAGESGFSGLELYLDDLDGIISDAAHERTTVTNAQGFYAFTGLIPGHTYRIGIQDLSGSYSATPLTVATPLASRTGIVTRYLPVTQLWATAQTVYVVDPLTPISIALAPPSSQSTLGFWPKFQLIAPVPVGMTIDPYSGLIHWIAPADHANSTVPVRVRIENTDSQDALEVQTVEFQIKINPLPPVVNPSTGGGGQGPVDNLSALATYINDVFGALLSRLPDSQEMARWSTKLESGLSRTAFVSDIAHSAERYTILAESVYLTVLDRAPTPTQAAKALDFFRSGGNSDRLTLHLLNSREFVKTHPDAPAYVNAVYRVLVQKDASAATTRREVAWLRSGGSRASLVFRISRSHAATMAKARQLADLYYGGHSRKRQIVRWAKALAQGTLNSDSLTIRILASKTYWNMMAN